MNLDKAQVKRILVITLSNVGDIILTTPVIKALKDDFPGSRIDVMVGPEGKEIFEEKAFLEKVYGEYLRFADMQRVDGSLETHAVHEKVKAIVSRLI